jgi:hypothetical protein
MAKKYNRVMYVLHQLVSVLEISETSSTKKYWEIIHYDDGDDVCKKEILIVKKK